MESTFSIGLFSFGILSLVPLMALGMKSARLAKDERATAQIARTLADEARQGTLALGSGTTSVSLDDQGAPLHSPEAAAYVAICTPQAIGNGSLTRLTLQITPQGARNRPRIYAVVFQTPPSSTP